MPFRVQLKRSKIVLLLTMLYILMVYNIISKKDDIMPEPITPRVDIAFKKLFGVDENKDLLISLINSIVSEEDQVASVTLLNPYNPRNFQNDKLSILDLKARGHTGKLYNIEMQFTNDADYDKRALYYWAKLYSDQLERSDEYSKLNKAIGIHILNFTSIPEVTKYHNVFHILEKDSKVRYFKDLELHTIELNKFIGGESKGYLDQAEELKLMLPKIKTALDRWLAFLTRYDLLKVKNLPKELADEKLTKALAVLEEMNFNAEEREAYESHLKWLRVEASALKRVRQEGVEEGLAKGEAKGRIANKIEIAKEMLSQGLEISWIAQVIKLSENELIKLREEAGFDVLAKSN